MEKDCAMVFILYGNVCNISSIVEKVKERGKLAIVHVDLIAGLSSKEVAVDFIKETSQPLYHTPIFRENQTTAGKKQIPFYLLPFNYMNF